MIYYIYTLRLPNTNNIFYVGITRGLKQREQSHRNNFRNKCILEVLEEIESANKKESHICEKFWIEQLRQWGFKITNRYGNKSFLKSKCETISMHLKEVPEDIKNMIDKERLRIWYFENIKLSREQVIYTILREWHVRKAKIIELQTELNNCKQAI